LWACPLPSCLFERIDHCGKLCISQPRRPTLGRNTDIVRSVENVIHFPISSSGVIGETCVDGSVEGDVVVVIYENQIVETQILSLTDGALRDPSRIYSLPCLSTQSFLASTCPSPSPSSASRQHFRPFHTYPHLLSSVASQVIVRGAPCTSDGNRNRQYRFYLRFEL